MVCGWNTGMVVVRTATDELLNIIKYISTSSPTQQIPVLAFSYWVNRTNTLPPSNGYCFWGTCSCGALRNPQLVKFCSKALSNVQIVFFSSWMHLWLSVLVLAWSSQITSNIHSVLALTIWCIFWSKFNEMPAYLHVDLLGSSSEVNNTDHCAHNKQPGFFFCSTEESRYFCFA